MAVSSELCDVIVVGGGSAAFEAAVAARQAGARKVIMLEKAPEPEFGGNARYSHTGFRWVFSAEEIRDFVPEVEDREYARMQIKAYTAERFTDDLLRVTLGRIDRDLAGVLVDQSNAAIHWTRDVGMQWELEHGVEIGGLRYFEPGMVIHPSGGVEGGLSQLTQWRQIALHIGIELRYESKVTAILGDERCVTGVRVLDRSRTYELQGGATVLCSGGFQANPEMRARYLGPNADLMKVRGSRHDTGEVLQMALALGAQPAGHWQGAHATPIDATFPDVEVSNKANRYGYPFGITVNSLGVRFFDEGEAESIYTYAKTGWTVLAEPGGVAYQLYDQKTLPLINNNYYRHANPIEAPTIPELAERIGIEPAILQHTVDEFNASVRDDVQFDATRRDGRCTQGIAPVKSNWAIQLDSPPYLAFPVTGGITFTFGGLQVDTHARVMGTSGRPIGGLFGSGDIIGLFFHNYPSCTGQTRNVVFSRLAGAGAAQAASS